MHQSSLCLFTHRLRHHGLLGSILPMYNLFSYFDIHMDLIFDKCQYGLAPQRLNSLFCHLLLFCSYVLEHTINCI
uniref:Uncharacterized protein n=1 Tax=Arundo donax TaxID=35708 RepID=A0A0A9ERK8_ARUDO